LTRNFGFSFSSESLRIRPTGVNVGLSVSTRIDSLWQFTTGTRTQVAATFSAGRPRILRDSLRIFSSSDDQPSALSEPAHGTTFIASGAGNGPRSPTAERTSPARWPSDRVPDTLSSCA
jgi:hypothetical protein